MTPLLESIENFCLFTDGSSGIECIVIHDTSKDERDSEISGVQSGFFGDNHEEGSDEGTMATWHAARTKESFVPSTSFYAFCTYLHSLTQESDDERNDENVRAEKGVH